MWTRDSINVGMLTSSSAAAISSSEVVKGTPACGLRINRSRGGTRAVLPAIGIASMPSLR